MLTDGIRGTVENAINNILFHPIVLYTIYPTFYFYVFYFYNLPSIQQRTYTSADIDKVNKLKQGSGYNEAT